MLDPINPISRLDLHRAEEVATRLPIVLAKRKLKPVFSRWMLTSYAGMSLLFGVLDTNQIGRLEAYTSPELLHHLSTDIGGLPVYLSNSTGLRYAVLLSAPPRLPRRVDFPGVTPGRAMLGVRYTGEPIGPDWIDLGHVLVAGMTGSGKSGMLRTLAYQAITESMQLLVADLDGTTLPMLAGHTSLLEPIAADPNSAHDLVRRALGELEHRAELYSRAGPGFSEKLEEYNGKPGVTPLPRIMVILDEFSATIQALGGPNSAFAKDVFQLGIRSRKFGVSLVFAAQEFSMQLMGAVRHQVRTAIAFQVNSKETARNIGCPEAARIKDGRPGLAVTNRWGPMQAYFLPKELLIAGAAPAGPRISAEELDLIEWSIRIAQGRMSIPMLMERGMGERAARNLVEDWQNRGWLEQDPAQKNARYITQKLRVLLSN